MTRFEFIRNYGKQMEERSLKREMYSHFNRITQVFMNTFKGRDYDDFSDLMMGYSIKHKDREFEFKITFKEITND